MLSFFATVSAKVGSRYHVGELQPLAAARAINVLIKNFKRIPFPATAHLRLNAYPPLIHCCCEKIPLALLIELFIDKDHFKIVNDIVTQAEALIDCAHDLVRRAAGVVDRVADHRLPAPHP